MDTVMITGGAGYIGSTLTRELLAKGYQVVVVDALRFGGESLLDLMGVPGFRFTRADITDRRELGVIFEKNRFDAVVHLAAVVGDPACAAEPELAAKTIWEASRDLFELCESHGVPRFLYASTCSNYGKMAGAAMLSEEAPLSPVSLYAELKVKFERFLLERETPVDYSIMRFATVYGLSLRPRFDLTINEFTRDAVIKGELEIYGPQFWRPYCHVRDIAQAVATLLSSPRERVSKRVFNIGSNDQNYQKTMIAEEIAKQVPFRVINVEKDEDPRDYRVNFDRVAALGWAPRYSLADGISEITSAIRTGLITDPYDHRYRNC